MNYDLRVDNHGDQALFAKAFGQSVQICDFLGEPVWLASMWLTRENFGNRFLLFVCSYLIGTMEETKVVYFLNFHIFSKAFLRNKSRGHIAP